MSNRPQAAPAGRQTKSALEQPTMTHRGVGTGHRSRLPAPLIYAVAAWEPVAQPSHSPPTAAAAGLVAAPPLRLRRAAIQSYKTHILYDILAIQNMGFVWLVLPALPLSLSLLLLGLPGCARAARRSAQPRPPLAPPGRLAVRGARRPSLGGRWEHSARCGGRERARAQRCKRRAALAAGHSLRS